ncbi:hypothetical protein GOB87_10050, partial [Acetobacter estunensis]|nr:hypothetical protein [Acetobacter estunensis]
MMAHTPTDSASSSFQTGKEGAPTRGRFPELDRVGLPVDLRNLSIDQLRQVADELRSET